MSPRPTHALQLGLLRTWRTIVADPPWPYDDPGIRGGVGHHYQTMSVDEIAAMRVRELAWDNAHLWLWITNSHLHEGVGAQVARAWGFEPKTILTWDKGSIGTGHYLRNQTEHAILAVRGTAPLKRDNVPTILRAKRSRQHSEKPPEFYYLVEDCCDGRYLELFARRQRDGGLRWDCWGDELAAPMSLPALDNPSDRRAAA